jgi:peptidoglycan/LPS O-acetylase OafA/YrhL
MPDKAVDAGFENNFGILRLLFSGLVIVSHSPEIIDGNRSREILTRIFGTLSFGEVAVDAFFLISGYLVSKSYVNSKSTRIYLIKRIARIVPGYLACFLLCVFVLAPLVGGTNPFTPDILKLNFKLLTRLVSPDVPGSFAALPYAALNGSMWTIAYEFRCYLLVVALGLAGAFAGARRYAIPVLAVVCLALNATEALSGFYIRFSGYLGDPAPSVRLAGLFLTGMSFYIFRASIRFSNAGALLCAVLLAGAMFISNLAEAAFAIFGGWLIFWFAFQVKPLWISKVATKTDISYGVYLYAWPVQSTLLGIAGLSDPWALCAAAFAITPIFATVSWFLIEKPALSASRGKVLSWAAKPI